MSQNTSKQLKTQQERVAVIEKVLEKMERVLRRARKLYAQECDYLDALVAMETEDAKAGTK
jgi:hypothetical protein